MPLWVCMLFTFDVCNILQTLCQKIKQFRIIQDSCPDEQLGNVIDRIAFLNFFSPSVAIIVSTLFSVSHIAVLGIKRYILTFVSFVAFDCCQVKHEACWSRLFLSLFARAWISLTVPLSAIFSNNVKDNFVLKIGFVSFAHISRFF